MIPSNRPVRVLPLILAALLASCKASPVVVSTECPKIPQPPAEMMTVPESLNASEKLESALRELALLLGVTPSDSTPASDTSNLF